MRWQLLKRLKAADPRLHLMLVAVMGLFCAVTIYATAQTTAVDSRLERAADLIHARQLNEAESELTAILRSAPNEPRALNLLGTVRAEQGNLTAAEALFLRALRFNNQLVAVHMNLAYLYMLKRLPERTIAQLKEVLRLEPNNAEATYKLSNLLLAQEHFDDCINLIEPQKDSAPAALLVVLGDAYLKKRDADKAEESYQLALTKENDNADALLGLAAVFEFRSDLKKAVAYIARAKNSVANSAATLYRFAMVEMRTGDYEEANAALTQAIKMNPNEPAYFLALGTTWLQKPDLLEAEKAFRQALALDPKNSPAQLSLGYTLLMQKKYPEAKEWLEKSLQMNMKLPETFYYLGQLAQEQNDDQRAIEFFVKAIELAPTYSYAHAALGASYLRLKNYPLAQRELELSIKINPDDARAHYDLAILFARLKNTERAQQEMQIVESLKQKTGSASKGPAAPRVPPQ